MITIKLLLAIIWLPFIISQDNINNEDNLNLDPNQDDGNVTCNTIDGRSGICVNEGYCDEEHHILPGGDIHSSEHRAAKPCRGSSMWCCTMESAISPPVINDTRSDACLPLDNDKCPWCAKLYKLLGTEKFNYRVSDLKNTADTDVFCAGSLIGSHIILTAATCLKAAQHHMLYARIPTSANPNHKYIAKHRKLHPQYNTGTHWFDYGIIVLNEAVNWGVTPAGGACLNFESISERCFTLGYDSNDEFVSTVIKVSKGRCSNLGGGGSTDVFCGTSTEDLCFASTGAPVICESNSGGLVMKGVLRSGCLHNNILLGSLTSATSWITRELEAMKVSKHIYTQR